MDRLNDSYFEDIVDQDSNDTNNRVGVSKNLI